MLFDKNVKKINDQTLLEKIMKKNFGNAFPPVAIEKEFISLLQ